MSDTLTLNIQENRCPASSEGAAHELIRRPPFPRRAHSTLVGSRKRDLAFRECIDAVRGYQDLPHDWDSYGGMAAADEPVAFAIELLQGLHWLTEIPAPTVRPISSGVYLEWRFGDSLLYFEVDDESVLCFRRDVFCKETTEDSSFDADKACHTAIEFLQNAA